MEFEKNIFIYDKFIYIIFQFFYEFNNIMNFFLFNQENIHKLKKIVSKILNNKNI